MFRGTWPSKPEQDYTTGRNNLYAAKMARYQYKIDKENFPPEEGYTQEFAIEFLTHI